MSRKNPLDDHLLASIGHDLTKFGRNRFPALRGEMDDLVNESLADLWRYVHGPSSPIKNLLCSHQHSGSAESKEALLRLARTIFRRRVADMFRSAAAQWAKTHVVSLEQVDLELAPIVENSKPERRLLMAQMLRICVRELTLVPRDDLDLLALVGGFGEEQTRKLSARERQRIHRLRGRLADTIRHELGERVQELLADDF